MDQIRRKSSFFLCHMALVALVSVLGTSDASAAASTPARQAESMDELYEKAKKEGAQLTLYIALSARSEENPALVQETLSRHSSEPHRRNLR